MTAGAPFIYSVPVRALHLTTETDLKELEEFLSGTTMRIPSWMPSAAGWLVRYDDEVRWVHPADFTGSYSPADQPTVSMTLHTGDVIPGKRGPFCSVCGWLPNPQQAAAMLFPGVEVVVTEVHGDLLGKAITLPHPDGGPR